MEKRITVNKREIYILPLHSSLIIYEEVTRNLEKNSLSFLMLCEGNDKRSHKEKKKTQFLEIKLLLKEKKKSQRTAKYIGLLNFFTKTITYSESNFNFTSLNYLCAL